MKYIVVFYICLDVVVFVLVLLYVSTQTFCFLLVSSNHIQLPHDVCLKLLETGDGADDWKR